MHDWGRRARRLTLGLFLLAMPVEFELEEASRARPDTIPADFREHSLTLGLHGGGGRVFSVVRSCDGTPTASQGTDLDNWEGSARLSLPRSHFNLVFGLDAGQLRTDLTPPPVLSYGDRLTYWIPSIALEAEKAGMGIGYLAGHVPQKFADEDDRRYPVAFHVRAGRLDGRHVVFSMLEATPAIAGGGALRLDLGYPLSSRLRARSGLSLGYFEGEGFAQSLAWRLDDRWSLDLAGRYSLSEFDEHAVAFGLRYRWTLGDANRR